MLFHYDLSVLIDVLLVVGTIVAAYCQKKATKAMEQEAKNNKRKNKNKKLRSRADKCHKGRNKT